MIDFSTLDELTRKLSAAVPPAAKEMRQDLEQQFRAVLQSAFERMDLVTREEFDVQQAVLARTREKLEELSSRLAALEAADQ
ncbi:MAG: accessory factor UbiK family protein [Wenzhouxiangellaceae bacterium]